MFTSLSFVLFAALVVVCINMAPGRLGNQLAYGSANAAFLLLFLGRVEAILLVGFALWGFLILRYVPSKWGALGLAVTLALFIWLKKYQLIPAGLRLEHLPTIVGLSYVLFRVLHLIVDKLQEAREPMSLSRYLNYTLCCFTLIAGPFQDLKSHDHSIAGQAGRDLIGPLSRICDGFLKAAVFAPVLLDWQVTIRSYALAKAYTTPPVAFDRFMINLGNWLNSHLGSQSAMFVAIEVLASILYLVFLYLNFSGYTDIVIGWAGLCGLQLPENFNYPILANDVLDFWNRWHMSMTNWFKTYVFTPTLKNLTMRRPRAESAFANTACAFFLTFLLMGLWHGPGWPFAACGMLLAAAAVLNHSYKTALRLWIDKQKAKELRSSWWYQVCAAGLTFTFLAVVVSPFWISEGDYFRLLTGSVGTPVVVLLALCVGVGVIVASVRRIWMLFVSAGERFGRLSLPRVALIGAKVNILFLGLLVNYRSLPDFVYKGF